MLSCGRAVLCCAVQAVELPLKISQTAAIMEVVHAAARIVKSPVGITGGCCHVGCRMGCVFGRFQEDIHPSLQVGLCMCSLQVPTMVHFGDVHVSCNPNGEGWG